MLTIKIKKYKKANILILNEWHKFIYVIFYKGKFYANEFEIKKVGDYTDKEFLQAIDGVLIAAKKTVDIITQQRSVFNILKFYVKTITLQVFRIANGNQEKPKTSSV